MSGLTNTPPSTTDETTTETPQAPKIRVVDMKLGNQNDALQVMCHFLAIAQKHGVYTMAESSKVWEAINFFIQPDGNSSSSSSDTPILH